MARSAFNPKPSDFAGQFRFGGICAVVGIMLLVFGLGGSEDWFHSILAILGVPLLIGGGAVILTALRNKIRAGRAEGD